MRKTPIPSTDLDGHTVVRERIGRALGMLVEAQAVEFKRSESWDALKGHIARTSMAMSNLRDGGLIIIGIMKNGNVYEKTGISQEHLDSYDPDAMAEFINKYASPNIQPLVITHTDVKGPRLKYLVIVIDQFSRVPIICKNQHDEYRLQVGRVYIRSTEKVESREIEHETELREVVELASQQIAREIVSREVKSEAEMRELVDVASQNAAREIVSRGLDAGLVYPQPPQEQPLRDKENDDRMQKIKERMREKRDELAKRLDQELGNL